MNAPIKQRSIGTPYQCTMSSPEIVANLNSAKISLILRCILAVLSIIIMALIIAGPGWCYHTYWTGTICGSNGSIGNWDGGVWGQTVIFLGTPAMALTALAMTYLIVWKKKVDLLKHQLYYLGGCAIVCLVF
ncbi:hypothetical protein L596_013073 [Steinernema carpocapsae]|uniref:Uncharacterized protein n=1 Tax=Steinernema carpocapsae TaxID=34508 RepID=A0A4U5NZR6_STECR|nr:hypothetical protein L596_013073 [Steinernema carpocapsae]